MREKHYFMADKPSEQDKYIDQFNVQTVSPNKTHAHACIAQKSPTRGTKLHWTMLEIMK